MVDDVIVPVSGNGVSGFSDEGMNDDPYVPYLSGIAELYRDVYTSISVNLLRREPNLEKYKVYLIDGKDVILSNLSNGGDDAIFKLRCDVINLLIDMQNKYYSDGSDGLVPAIDFIYKQNLTHVLATRAKGDKRDRLLIVNDNVVRNLSPGPVKKGFNNLFGLGKKSDDVNYDASQL